MTIENKRTCTALAFPFFTSAVCAAGGGVGTAILRPNYRGYEIPEHVALYGAVGGLLFGVVYACLYSLVDRSFKKSNCAALILHVASTILSGLLGQAIVIYCENSYKTAMDSSHTAAAFAVGGAITLPAVSLFLYCVFRVYECLKNENSEQSTRLEIRPLLV